MDSELQVEHPALSELEAKGSSIEMKEPLRGRWYISRGGMCCALYKAGFLFRLLLLAGLLRGRVLNVGCCCVELLCILVVTDSQVHGEQDTWLPGCVTHLF